MLTRRRLFEGLASLAVISTALATLDAQTPPAPDSHAHVTLTGQVTSVAEGAMEGVVVTVKREGSTIAHSVISNAQGKYRFPVGKIHAGAYALSIRAVGYDLDRPDAVNKATRPVAARKARVTRPSAVSGFMPQAVRST